MREEREGGGGGGQRKRVARGGAQVSRRPGDGAAWGDENGLMARETQRGIESFPTMCAPRVENLQNSNFVERFSAPALHRDKARRV